MKIQYFGTAAAEGVPAMFCECSVCTNAKLNGGKDLRTRSQMLINEDLLIDFSADSYLHFLKYNVKYESIQNLLVSHTHWDHFYPEDLMMRSPMYVKQTKNSLNIYGNQKAGELLKQKQLDDQIPMNDSLIFNELKEYKEYKIGKYKIIPLLADHDKREKCFIFDIQYDDKRMLYGHDTGFIIEKNWDYWSVEQPFYHFVTLDCTNQEIPSNGNHMNIMDNLKVKEKMESLGYVDSNTIFCSSHFSHNGGLSYDQMANISLRNNIITAHDGLKIIF